MIKKKTNYHDYNLSEISDPVPTHYSDYRVYRHTAIRIAIYYGLNYNR